MSSAFLSAILNYVKDQTQLDTILKNLDTVQASSYGG